MEAKLDLPFDVPESLRSYVTQFESDSDKAIETLRSYLRKRGMDAVGHFLLAWFYYKKGKHTAAMEYALKARSFAPGSPFLEHVHYYFVHPKAFNASLPDVATQHKESNNSYGSGQNFVLDLDKLISKLADAESKKIQITDTNDDRDLSVKSGKTDGIATVTLAQIFEKQGNAKDAIATYQQLIQTRPAQKKKFEKEIKRLKSLK